MAKDYIEPNKSVISRSSSIAHQLFRSVGRIVSLLVFGLIITIVVELLLVTFIRPDIGVLHSRELLAAEVRYLDGIAMSNPFVDGGEQSVYRWLADADRALFSLFAIAPLQGIAHYLEVIVNMFNVFVIRVCVMLFSFPVYVFCGIIGMTRGLVNRELRKWGGGRESSGQFHLWMNLVPFGFMGSWILYLSWPASLNPNYVVMPFAIFFGWMLMLTTYRMKKYL